jgi:hypothetical protein
MFGSVQIEERLPEKNVAKLEESVTEDSGVKRPP